VWEDLHARDDESIQRGLTMDNSIWGMLNETEKTLLRSAEPKELKKLDEDGLSEIHGRIRRTRNKYSKLYRRRAGAQVVDSASRSKGHSRHERTLIKAEAFEEALERHSKRLTQAARVTADTIRDDRLELAGTARPRKATTKKSGAKKSAAKKPVAKKKAGKLAKGRTPAKLKTPVSKRSTASNRATKARTQAKRDSR